MGVPCQGTPAVVHRSLTGAICLLIVLYPSGWCGGVYSCKKKEKQKRNNKDTQNASSLHRTTTKYNQSQPQPITTTTNHKSSQPQPITTNRSQPQEMETTTNDNHNHNQPQPITTTTNHNQSQPQPITTIHNHNQSWTNHNHNQSQPQPNTTTTNHNQSQPQPITTNHNHNQPQPIMAPTTNDNHTQPQPTTTTTNHNQSQPQPQPIKVPSLGHTPASFFLISHVCCFLWFCLIIHCPLWKAMAQKMCESVERGREGCCGLVWVGCWGGAIFAIFASLLVQFGVFCARGGKLAMHLILG